VPQLWAHPWLDLGVLTVIYLLMHEALWRALARFPWPTEGIVVDRNLPLRQEKEFGPSCGWPYDRFHRDIRIARGLRKSDALLISMLAGWSVYSLEPWLAFLSTSPAVAFNVAVFTVLQRLWIYRQGYAAPISLAGRLASGRWIIPRHDQVYLGPLLALMGLTGGLVLGRVLEFGPRGSFAMATFLAFLPALSAPPSLRRWRLTAEHRLVPALQENNPLYVKVG
jgi:hypothetical protein